MLFFEAAFLKRVLKPGVPFQRVLAAALGLCCVQMPGFRCVTAARAQEGDAASSPAAQIYQAGLAAMSRNDPQAALKNFQEVTRLAPSAEAGHSMAGFVLARLGRYHEAVPELERAVALKPDDSDARMNLAMAYEQVGSPAKAVSQFAQLDSAARSQGRNLPAASLAAYAHCLAATKQWDAAAAKFSAAASADPRNAELHDEFGTFDALRQDWPRAEEQFVEAVRLKPDFAMAHLHLGVALQALGQPSALAELREAYRLAPQNPTMASELGKTLALSGHDDQAIPILEHALKLAPKSPAASYSLALAYQRSGRVQEAASLLRRLVASEPRNADALTNLGLALCQLHQAKDAVPFLYRAVLLAPQNITAHQDLAAAYVTLGQFDDAIAQLRAALKLAPNDPRAHYDLGVAYKMQDNASAAIPELQAAEKLDPSASEAPYALGMIYMQNGRDEDAARQLNVSLKLHPENGEGWAALGSVYSTLGKLPEAAAALREAIRQLPDQADPHLTFATVLMQQGETAEAAAERKKAAQLMRAHMNLQRAQVATNAAQSLLKAGSVQDAITQFKDALGYDPNYVEAHLGLASALERQGMMLDAAAERQKANELKKAAGSTTSQ